MASKQPLVAVTSRGLSRSLFSPSFSSTWPDEAVARCRSGERPDPRECAVLAFRRLLGFSRPQPPAKWGLLSQSSRPRLGVCSRKRELPDARALRLAYEFRRGEH